MVLNFLSQREKKKRGRGVIKEGRKRKEGIPFFPLTAREEKKKKRVDQKKRKKV